MSELSRPYQLMAKNNAWANATLHAAISALEQAAFEAERPGFFPSLQATMQHIYEVDLYYLDALQSGGIGLAIFDQSPPETATDLGAAQAATDLRLIQFCADLSAETLAQTRVTERGKGAFHETVEALLLHLFQHQIHHRGQAHVQLQSAGITPPQLDDFHLEYERVPTAAAYFAP
tara:strand:- start:143 stop:670 length:528 start_codon:yes stop_codon:yes gene_type:complete